MGLIAARGISAASRLYFGECLKAAPRFCYRPPLFFCVVDWGSFRHGQGQLHVFSGKGAQRVQDADHPAAARRFARRGLASDLVEPPGPAGGPLLRALRGDLPFRAGYGGAFLEGPRRRPAALRETAAEAE